MPLPISERYESIYSGEPKSVYRVRTHRAARLVKLKEVKAALGKVTEENSLYFAIQGIVEIIDDILYEKFV